MKDLTEAMLYLVIKAELGYITDEEAMSALKGLNGSFIEKDQQLGYDFKSICDDIKLRWMNEFAGAVK